MKKTTEKCCAVEFSWNVSQDAAQPIQANSTELIDAVEINRFGLSFRSSNCSLVTHTHTHTQERRSVKIQFG